VTSPKTPFRVIQDSLYVTYNILYVVYKLPQWPSGARAVDHAHWPSPPGHKQRLARVHVGDLLKERTPSDIAFRLLWSEGISPFHGEARFADLRGICRGNTGELRADVIDDV
jgi:hypothetical protein